MNITHFDDVKVEGDRLVAIFNRQKELMDKYHYIELKSRLLQTEDVPVNINDRKGQARLKDFAWRMTEELGEAIDSLYGDKDEIHYCEELVDGLHFLTELTILAGMEPKDICPSDWTEDMGDLLEAVAGYIQYCPENTSCATKRNYFYVRHIRTLGMTCNCLKNKPWKQTMMMTDKEAFYSNLKDVWYNYLALMKMEMGTDGIFQTYFKKSEVNKFRQRSNY